jgi:hypothetical protein
VLLGDADVEVALGMLRRKRSSAVPLGMAPVMATIFEFVSASLTSVLAKTSE